MMKAEDGPGGAARAFTKHDVSGGVHLERGPNSAPADSTDLRSEDLEQPMYPRSFESSADVSNLSKRAPWWSRWRTSGSWQKVSTSEKEPSPQARGPHGPSRGSKLLASVAGASVIVNLVLLMLLLVASGLWHVTSGGGIALLGSWAVDEASTVLAAESFVCSGRGVRYADTTGDGCECDQCYHGLDCSELMSNCSVDLSSGTPTLFQDYWTANLEASAAFIPGNFRLGYSDGNLEGLESAVRKLHATVGNVNMDGRQLVMSAGSTQMIFGLLYAISAVNRENGFQGKTAVTSAPPYYNLYSYGTKMESSELFEWRAYADVINASAPSINFVVSPNNPDGRLGDPEFPPPSVAIHDFAYYWPHFTAITAEADYDVMLFTLSKVSGHAGSRVGWVWLRDARLAEVLRLYLMIHSITMSHESQYRAIKLISAITDGYASAAERTASLTGFTPQAAAAEGRLFHFAKLVMQNRWDRLHSVLGTTGTDSQTRVTIQALPPAASCGFFQQTVTPSPAYAYLHCRLATDPDCFELLRANGIVGRPGVVFGGDSSFVRLSLLGRESDFVLTLERLKTIAES
ncbi:Pyridoxal phosphate (PLP)-dependent transferases superfamily protein [Klebsormidium nitens]|uniref:Pyridoxal phosphate (PLP)-dependent transferases superfamily protein n=1 Tax=Klebsormidium nitens TaxID=105231 RepID=A0A1Y1HWT5_KLENI|nr:Pyridoxal phosphate (PLP)-dependent transferases superfamily protein [Klebsormidium nitens]|eukprot:GAQ80308.1 Pyridoxal phosphate (PLP)-dependent transferases superfamily protein [Klebsormidium nitens]